MAQSVLDSKLRTFEEFFSPESLASIFEKRVRGESGCGRDHLSPDRFVELYPQGFDIISKQCLSNSYVFGPYKEILCLKGRGKTPRVLSIPTVRDKIVLSALTEYMQENFPQCVEHRTPNAFIRKIKDFCKNTTCGLKFFKTDIVGFFENIDHDLLLQKIGKVISDERVLSLVRASINTPTLASGEKLSTKPNIKGVPHKFQTEITIFTIAISILTLVISLIIQNMKYDEREKNYHLCGEKMNELYDKADLLQKSSPKDIDSLEKLYNEYHQILKDHNLNHREIDYLRAEHSKNVCYGFWWLFSSGWVLYFMAIVMPIVLFLLFIVSKM